MIIHVLLFTENVGNCIITLNIVEIGGEKCESSWCLHGGWSIAAYI